MSFPSGVLSRDKLLAAPPAPQGSWPGLPLPQHLSQLACHGSLDHLPACTRILVKGSASGDPTFSLSSVEKEVSRDRLTLGSGALTMDSTVETPGLAGRKPWAGHQGRLVINAF